MAIFNSYVSLPEGKTYDSSKQPSPPQSSGSKTSKKLLLPKTLKAGQVLAVLSEHVELEDKDIPWPNMQIQAMGPWGLYAGHESYSIIVIDTVYTVYNHHIPLLY